MKAVQVCLAVITIMMQMEERPVTPLRDCSVDLIIMTIMVEKPVEANLSYLEVIITTIRITTRKVRVIPASLEG